MVDLFIVSICIELTMFNNLQDNKKAKIPDPA